jgi:lipocalin
MTPRDWPISHVGSSRSFWASILIFVALLLSSQLALAQFTQQGPKLVGTGYITSPEQGVVALSADGNTAIVGGPIDNDSAGAVWVYTRSNGVWTQQGSKLVGNDAVNSPVAASQGTSVALSADGNTAIVGGFEDNSATGAAWVFTRSNGVWTQQGSKLVGNDAVGTTVYQGNSVALSADGNTAIVGGPEDNSGAGAAWIYTRSNGVWTQQGAKLVGNDAAGPALQGTRVALSADGNTAIVGGPYDNGGAYGATWVFTRSNGVWTQQGSKLVGTGAVGSALQGSSVALSGDGNTAIVGGYHDNNLGAVWVYTRSNGVWTQQGAKLVGTGALGSTIFQGYSVSMSTDGNTAIVGGPEDNSGAGAVWAFTRSNGVWTQQGNKLVGNDAVAPSYQGASVGVATTRASGRRGSLSNLACKSPPPTT